MANNVAQVGGIQKDAELFYSKEGKLIAIEMRYFQDGCYFENNESHQSYFNNLVEAKRNGCLEGDVSWQATELLDHVLRQVSQTPMMWTGW